MEDPNMIMENIIKMLVAPLSKCLNTGKVNSQKLGLKVGVQGHQGHGGAHHVHGVGYHYYLLHLYQNAS